MRFSLKFILLNEEKKIPLNYRNMFLSIIKKIFENGNLKTYKEYYEERKEHKSNALKPFTFSVYMPCPEFHDNEIYIEQGYIILNFSTSDTEKGIYFYNGIYGQKEKIFTYKTYNLKVDSLNLKKEKLISNNEILFKTMSPIIVRKHFSKNNIDEYLTFENDDFKSELENIVKYRLKKLTGQNRNIEIVKMSLKKIAIKHKVNDNKIIIINGNVGNIILKGDIDVLDLLYKSGIGSRTGEGFGMLEII